MFFGFFHALLAQECNLSVRGQVNDEDNHEHLAFAVVQLLPLASVVQCDEHGDFEFSGLCAGQYSLLISHVGCRDTTIAIQLAKKSVKLNLRMPHSYNALSDVEVLAAHEELQPAQTAVVLSMRELNFERGKTLAEQLRRVPGVSVLNTGPNISRPMVNGMQGYRILLLNNGIRLEGQQWGTEHAPEIDPFAARKITVLKGAAAVRYGSDAIGGVILVESDQLPDTAALTAELESTYASNGRVFSNAARIQGYFDRFKYFNWRVQASQRNGGTIKAPDYYLRNTGVDEKNFSYALGYHRKMFGAGIFYSQVNMTTGIFSGAHTGNLTDLKLAFISGKPTDSLAGFERQIHAPYQKVSHELIKLDADLHTGARSRFNFVYALQYNRRMEFDAHETETINEPAADFDLSTNSADVNWEHDYIKGWRGRFGMQGMQQENLTDGSTVVPNYAATSYGAYAIERFVRAHYEIEGGIRYDKKQQQAYFYRNGNLTDPRMEFDNLSYSLGTLYRFSKFRFTLAAASGWRAPAMNELYGDGLHHGAAAIEKGNDQLGKEQSLSLTAGAEGRWKRLGFNLSAYSYQFSNYIYYAPSPEPELTVRGAFPVFRYTQSAAGITGADAAVKIELLSFWDLHAKAIWLRGRNTTTNEWLIYMPADRYEVSFRFHRDKLHRFYNLYCQPVLQFSDKQVRVPGNIDFAPPPESYFLLNFEAGFEVKAGKQSLLFSLSARNIMNAGYRDYLDRLRYFMDAPGRNLMLRIRMPLTLFDKD